MLEKFVHSISAYDSPRTGAIQTPYLLTGLLLYIYIKSHSIAWAFDILEQGRLAMTSRKLMRTSARGRCTKYFAALPSKSTEDRYYEVKRYYYLMSDYDEPRNY